MGLFSGIVDAVKFVAKSVGKMSVTDFAIGLASRMPQVIGSITEAVKMAGDGLQPEEIKKIIDDALEEFDAQTGSDTGGVRLLPEFDAGMEEKALDHFKEFARLVAYSKFKIKAD